MFTIYWGEVSADSDGPIEMVQAGPGRGTPRSLASHYPELTLRTEPAHQRGVRHALDGACRLARR